MPTIWYKEQRTKEERREIYQRLRGMGYPAEVARRLRDWSESHIELFIRSYPPELFKKIREEREFYEAYPELEFQVSGIDYTGIRGE
ncbi:hypothetical protein [Thermococcus sp.]